MSDQRDLNIEAAHARLEALEARIETLEARLEGREQGGGPHYYESGTIRPDLDDQTITP